MANKEETFESYMNKIFPKDCEAYIRLKQLHDKSIKFEREHARLLIGDNKHFERVIKEKDKQIVELESKELNMIIKIKELQAENILIKEALERLLKGKALGTEIDLIKRK